MDIIAPIVVGLASLGALAVIIPTIGQSMKMQPYLYANTRTSARSGFMLKEKDYQEMAQVSYPKELFGVMENTQYKDIYARHNEFKDLSKALEKNLFETFEWVEEISPKKLQKLVNLINRKFEIKEVKKILNHLKNQEDLTEIDFVSDSFLKIKLQEVRSFQDLTNAVSETFYADIFSDKTIEDLPMINTSLDKKWLEEVWAETNKIGDPAGAVRDYWMTMIDLFNTRLALRKLEKEINVEFIVEGNVPIKDLESASDLNQLECVFEKTCYKEHFSKESFLDIENCFFKYLRKLGYELNAKFTLTSGPIIQFMIEKELEIRNLNVITKLKLNNFPKEKVEKLVV
ncbi:MAG: V-type ATPase subunit [Nanoarchaeota archaeon]|nr:V-type ATPase subunit [Nanoarchaeota archaeon]